MVTVSDRTVRLGCVLLALSLAVLVLSWADLESRDIADIAIRRLEAAPLAAADPSLIKGARFETISEPFRLPGQFAVARLTIEAPADLTREMALFVRRGRDNYAVYVNGRLAAPISGHLGEPTTLDGLSPRLFPILPGFLVPGKNHIDLLAARNTTRPMLREIYFGPRERLEPAYTHTWLIMTGIPALSATAATLVAMFAFALSWLIRRPALIICISLTLAFILARELYSLWVVLAWDQSLRDGLGIWASTGAWISTAAFVNEWTAGPSVLRLRYAVLALLAWAGTAAAFMSLEWKQAFLIAASLELMVIALTVPYVAVRLFRHYRSAPPAAAGEMVAFATAFFLAVFTFIAQQGVDFHFSASLPLHADASSRFASLALIFAIAVGLSRHGVDLYALAQLNNETLAARVNEKEQELEANHARLRDQEREHAALAERGRIMRDVHDGIGSQLLGLLLQARAGTLKGDGLTVGLQQALDDLHLVVDSLDQVEGPLEVALGTFRNRIAPKCEAAGVEVGWNINDVGGFKGSGPASILQIYRILQEACSNAIRHGKPRHLDFSLRRTEAGEGGIEIIVRDDGSGFEADRVIAGRGLASMRRRAVLIGGDLRIDSDASGSTVRIFLPA